MGQPPNQSSQDPNSKRISSVKVILQERECVSCGKIYKVMESSGQKFCNKSCEYFFDPSKRGRGHDWVGAKRGKLDVKSSVELNINGDGTTSPDLQKKNANASEKNIRPTLLGRAREQGKVTNGTSKLEIMLAQSGEEKTETNNLKTKGNIMQPTENTSQESSTKHAVVETQPSGFANQSENLSQEAFHSMSLLKETNRQLFFLMKNLNPQEINPEVRLLDTERVKVAAECAKQIISTMRMQLDIFKFKKELDDEKRP